MGKMGVAGGVSTVSIHEAELESDWSQPKLNPVPLEARC